ncbi:DUF2971 domain-containing protein [Rhodococcus sp. (in: high G+C Gram-positive bacteria)]|uniref:DUF2971 domain-containing protein n=1 Tax=Rhodococcus sp. TaxID=1831 RepID=UPI00257EE78F|nr:DUF2971 domain-containing protein [Rhodococcus sp. (in: high G+C Gram-positive bacteria)]
MHNIDELPTTKRLLKADIPDMLFHYTSAASAISIINNRQFWAGMPEQMNDSREIHQAFRWLSIIAGNTELDSPRNSADQLFGKWVRMQLAAGRAITGKPSFMISLSKQGDSLSQWRAYCERSGGICLGLPSDLIQTAAAKQEWLLAPCIYDEDEVETMVRELFEWHLTKFRETDKRIGMVSPGDRSHVDATVSRAQKLFDDLRMYGHFIKNPSFHAEEEWRLLKFDIEPELADLEFAPGRDGVRTFLPFQILEAGTHTDFPTKPRPSLRTGPATLPGTMTYATERLLERWVGAGNADVFHTHSSFR